MRHLKCSLDGLTVSEAPSPPHPFNTSLCAAQLCRDGFSLELFFSILYTTTYVTFDVYKQEQHCGCLPGETVQGCTLLSLRLNRTASPPSLLGPVFHTAFDSLEQL